MSEAVPTKPGPVVGAMAQEVQGIFPSDAAMQDAVARLTQAGFDRADLSLPKASPATQEATPEQGADAVTTDTDMRQVRTMVTSMAGSVGAIAAAGAVIATGGAAALAIGAAAAIGGGAAVLSAAGGKAADDVQHEAHQQAAARGELVLSVRATTPERQADATALMRSAGASAVATVERETADVRPTASPG